MPKPEDDHNRRRRCRRNVCPLYVLGRYILPACVRACMCVNDYGTLYDNIMYTIINISHFSTRAITKRF